MKRPVALGLAPNLEKVDADKALLLLFFPWLNNNKSAERLEEWFENYYTGFHAFSFTSARGALFAILSNLHLTPGDEVLVMAFTCRAVIDPILQAQLHPVYADIQKDFQISKDDVMRKITKRTKVLILQHTFGIANIDEAFLKKIKEKGIVVIEDVAHGIGISFTNKLLGTWGDAAIFSFGRDKAFSCVSGGIAITKDKKLMQELQSFQQKQPYPSFWWTMQQLFHCVSFYYLILPFYNTFSIGKIILVLFQKFHLLSLPVEKNSKGLQKLYYKKLPDALAQLALVQVSRLEKFNKKREEYTKMYAALIHKNFPDTVRFAGPLLRYPFFTTNPIRMKQYFRKHANIYLGDWYSNVIDPVSTNWIDVMYQKGSCPEAEYVAHHCINLPTYPTLTKTQAEKIAMLLTEYDNN